MNKFKLSILSIGVAGAMSLSSCSESFLDVSSKTSSNTQNFYKSEGDAWRALLGCYDGWRQLSSAPGVGMYCAATVMSDECYGAVGTGDDGSYQVIDRFDTSYAPSLGQIYSIDWKRYYAGVYRCNEFLAHEEQIDWKDENIHSLYIGETRAIRAMLYFDMVRLWGNIPLFLEPVNENRAQADPDDVYAAIFADLLYAAENIPADANLAVSDNGRITKYAVEAILARAFLYYTGYYGKSEASFNADTEEPLTVTKADALAAVEDIIANGSYELVPEFANLWPAASLVPIPGNVGWDTELSTYAGDCNSEVVLAMKFTPTQDYNGNNDSNRWLVQVGMRSINDPVHGYGKGWGGATVCPTFLENFDAADERLIPSVIDMEAEGLTGNAIWESAIADWREYTGFCIKKYCPMVYGNETPFTNPDGTGDFMTQNPEQYVLVRYADVLLMAAELGSPNAANYMHQVRNRAGLDDIAVNQANIMAERARELAFEGIRYWDLLRQGIDVAADAICASEGMTLSATIPDFVTFKRSKIVATKGLSQIPQDQITLSNGVLKQNAGW